MDYLELTRIVHYFKKLATYKFYYIGKSKIEGNGIIAQNNIPSGTIIDIAIVGGNITKNFGSYINHQFNCNSKLIEKENNVVVIAIKNISPGEEITINYKHTPWYIDKNTEGFLEL